MEGVGKMSNHQMFSMNEQFNLCINKSCDINLEANEFPFKRVLSRRP